MAFQHVGFLSSAEVVEPQRKRTRHVISPAPCVDARETSSERAFLAALGKMD